MIQSVHGREADKELGPGRVGILLARHGENPAVMRMIVEFGFDFVAGTAGAVTAFLGWVFRIRIASLDHETLHDSMKNRAIIKARARQFLEVLNRGGSGIAPK